MSEKINSIMETTMEKLKTMATADTIVGEPITLDDGIKAIPISKVSYGFASGGSDIPSKSEKAVFGGGGGAGMSVTPVAFLVLSGGNVSVVPIRAEASAGESLISMLPDFVTKLKGAISNKGENNSDKTETE